MKLLITSAGFTNKSISDALLEMASRPFGELKLAFIPTAANVKAGDKKWLIRHLLGCERLGFLEMDIIDFSALPKNIWKSRMEEADVLVFGGGNTLHLTHCLKDSGLAELLPKMLEGKIYVGISAGGMILGKSLLVNQPRKTCCDKKFSAEIETGLGLIDFEIKPHLNSKNFPEATLENLEEFAKENPKTSFYAIDNDTAIKVVDGKAEVVSEGEWKKFN